MKMIGMRQLIRSGEMSPDEAIGIVKKSSKTPSQSFLAWCESTGRRRYEAAVASNKKAAAEISTGNQPVEKKRRGK